jgi:hypothetical protein
MERTKVESGLIASIGYDAATQTLEVEIITHRPKNVVYTYSPFSPERYAEFMAAESKGKWFLKNIKPDKSLTYKKVGEIEVKETNGGTSSSNETEANLRKADNSKA